MAEYQATSKTGDFTEPITVSLGDGPDRQDVLLVNVLPRSREELGELLKLVLGEVHAAQGPHAERVRARRQAAATAAATAAHISMIEAIARPPVFREVVRDKDGRILGVVERPQLPADAA